MFKHTSAKVVLLINSSEFRGNRHGGSGRAERHNTTFQVTIDHQIFSKRELLELSEWIKELSDNLGD